MTQLIHRNITRLKHVTNNEGGRAYLDLKYKEFILHYPDRLKESILSTNTDELIALYQKVDGGRDNYLTHLV